MFDHFLLMLIVATLAAGGMVYIIGYNSREDELRDLLRRHGSRVRVLLIGRSMTVFEIAEELSIDLWEVMDVLNCLELQGTVKKTEGRYTFYLSG